MKFAPEPQMADPTQVPIDLLRTTTYKKKKGSHLIATGTAQHEEPNQREERTITSLSEYLQSLPVDRKWSLEAMTIPEDEATNLAEAIKNGTAIAVSDGSFSNEFGTASWVIEGANSHGRITGNNISPGDRLDQNAYRSELSGLYGIVLTIQAICQFHKISNGAVVSSENHGSW